MISSESCVCGSDKREANRGGEEDLAVVEGDRRADGLADGLGEIGDARGILLREQDQAELVAGEPRQRVLRLEDAGQPPRQGQQDRIADRDADGIVDLLEAVEIDHHQGRPQGRHGLGEIRDRAEPVHEQLAVRQAREIVVHGVVQHALFGVAQIGDVGERADHARDLAIGADHGPRLERKPHEMTVGRAQPEVLHQAAAALIEHAVECGAEAVLVERVQHLQPFRGGAFQGAALQPEQALGLRAGEHLVGGDIPVPDQIAGAGERQRAALDVGDDACGGAAAGKGVLHHRKSDQHHDQHEAAEQGRADDVVGDGAGNRHAGRDHPHHQQEPGRDQQHRAVEAVGREIDDQREAREGDQHQRHARDAGGHRRIEQCERDQGAEEGEPAHRDVGIAHMPAAEIEIGEQEHQQGRGEDGFACRAPDALGVVRHVEHLAPEAEVDADIDQHRPGQRRRGGEHDRALHHEQDGEHEGKKSGDADHDALVQRERVDLVLVGVGLPQIELRQLVGAQFRDEGDDGAGIERDAEHVGGRALLAVGPVAGRRGDGCDARQPEIGPQQARCDDAVMRRDDQTVELVVGVVGEREHHPVLSAFTRAHLDAADDAVGAGRGGDLDAVAVAALMFQHRGEIDCGRVAADADGVKRVGRRRGDHNHEPQHQCCQAPDQTQIQSPRSPLGSPLLAW